MKNVILCLLMIIGMSAHAQLPSGIITRLDNHLDTLSAPTGTYSGNTVYYAKDTVRKIMERYKTESDATWKNYFSDYLYNHPLTYNLENYLRHEAVYYGTTDKKDKIQYALFQASIDLQSQALDTISSWQTAFWDTLGLVQQVNGYNFFIYQMCTDHRVVRDYKNQTVAHYAGLYADYGTYLRKNVHLDFSVLGRMAEFKDQCLSTLSAISQLDVSYKNQVKNITGIAQSSFPHEKLLFDDFTIIFLNNNDLIDNNFKAIHYLLSCFPPHFTTYNVISTNYDDKNYGSTYNLHGCNLFHHNTGDVNLSIMNDAKQPDRYDAFLQVLAHEYAHTLDWTARTDGTQLGPHRTKIIDAAGTDRYNYLNITTDGFYYNTRQEYFASHSHKYLLDTRRTFEQALSRYTRHGRTLPMDIFLDMANSFCNNTDSTLFFSSSTGVTAEFEMYKVGIERNADSFITKIILSDCEVYEFVLDDQNLVKHIIEVQPELTPGTATCKDWDSDNDGILNTHEGYDAALFDLGVWNNQTAPATLLYPQPGTISGKDVHLKLSSHSSDQHVNVRDTAQLFLSRDPSGDGSSLEFTGLYSDTDFAQATFEFDVPVCDLSFVITDVDFGNLAGPERIEIIAEHKGKVIQLDKNSMQNLTPGQVAPSIDNNLLTGDANGYANTQQIRYYDPIDKITFRATGSSSSQVSLAYTIFNLHWSKDTDGDGLSDNYDTDSDGDGCPDAVEGSKSLSLSDLDDQRQLSGDQDAQGVPLLATGGQGVGTSADLSTQAIDCQYCNPNSSLFEDMDGDSVADNCDLDNDNDGILDTVECSNLVGFDFDEIDSFTSLKGSYKNVTIPQQNHNSHMFVRLTGWRGVDSNDALVRAVASGAPHSQRDPSGDGSLLSFEGPHSYYAGGHAEFTFNPAVYELSFAVTDIDGGDVHGPEYLEVRAYKNNQEIKLHPGNIELIAGAQAPELYDNTLNGANASSDNTIRITYDQPVEKLILRARATDRYAVDLDISVFNLSWYPDYDGDDLANNADTDSDDDLCWDAVEGAHAIQKSQVDSTTGYISTWIDAHGVPAANGTYQPVGTSQDAQIQDPDCSVSLYLDEEGNPFIGDTSSIQAFEVYPVPAARGTPVVIKKWELHHVRLLTAEGRILIDKVLPDAPKRWTLDTQGLVPGVYMLEINDSDLRKLIIH